MMEHMRNRNLTAVVRCIAVVAAVIVAFLSSIVAFAEKDNVFSSMGRM